MRRNIVKFSIMMIMLYVLFPFCKRNVMDLSGRSDEGTENTWQNTIQQMVEPVVRYRCGMSYIGNGKVIIYGGYSRNNNNPYEFQVNDVWEYDVKDPSWHPLNTPWEMQPRSDVAMTYAGDGRALLYGGESNYTLNGKDYITKKHYDTWLYDRASDTWQQLDDGSDTLKVNPAVYFGHSMTYIGENKALLFGGSVWSDADTAFVPTNQLLEFDITSNSWTDLSLGDELSPPACDNAVFVYIGYDQVVYVGRGFEQVETWIYKISARQWQNVTAQSMLIPSNYGTGAYLGASKLLMYTSGNRFRGSAPTTWLFDATNMTWQNMTSTRSLTPPSRSGQAMTFGGNSKVILFGGSISGLGIWNDTWEFNGGHLSNLAYQ